MISLGQAVREIMGVKPPDTSGIAEKVWVRSPDPERHDSMLFQRYNSGRIDGVIFVNGRDFVSHDMKGTNWDEILQKVNTSVESGWERVE